jgi:acetyl-CoA carboxylase carboxyltransferase component
MAVSGPRVLEIATGERVGSEELGGWELHARTTGLADRAAEDEDDCLRLIREFLSYLPSNAEEAPPFLAARESAEAAQARQNGLARLVPDSSRRAYDMRELIRTLADDRIIFELKPDFDRSVTTCLARLDGRTVGILASNPLFSAGAMGPDGCDKATSFICLCDSFNVPMVFLHDTPGFFVGKAAEQKRMPGKIINFVEALSLATVPIVSVVIRKSYGMAYSNMAGPGMDADFVFAWPGADISFMSPEVAVNVIRPRSLEGAHDREEKSRLYEELRSASAPWRAAGLGYIDDVIAPAHTRNILIQSIAIARGRRSGGIGDHRLAVWPTSF